MTNPTENRYQEKPIKKAVVAAAVLFALPIMLFSIYTSYVAGTKEPHIYWRVDFESGQLKPRNSGWHDSIGLSQLTDAHKDCAIESIGNGDPGLLKYSGCDDSHFAAGYGFRLTAASGLTDLNDVLIRVCDDGSLNKTADTFHMCTDNWPLYSAKEDPDNLTEFPIDTRMMGVHDSGTGTLKQYKNLAVASGGLGPKSSELCHVEDSTNSMGGDSDILARNGSYFFRCEIRYNLPYEVWGGGNSRNKPRYGLSPPNATHFHWDEEVWIGFSTYVPSDMEVEDLSAIHKHWYGNMVFTIVGYSASMDHLQLRIQSIDGVNHWVFEDTLNQFDVTQDGIETFTDAGRIPQGEWTDFVIRYRGNPFSTATNASQVTGKGQDRVFPANTGILQIWVGAESDSALTLVKDVQNAPVGLVPQEGAFLRMTFRNYKYGWHHIATTMHRPIVTGWDAIRFGKKERDGTGYSNVHPDGDSMPRQQQ